MIYKENLVNCLDEIIFTVLDIMADDIISSLIEEKCYKYDVEEIFIEAKKRYEKHYETTLELPDLKEIGIPDNKNHKKIKLEKVKHDN